jgi:IS5 family transposase
LIEPYYPKAGGGRKPYLLETMLRIHLLKNCFLLSDPAMEEALDEITPMRQFVRLTLSAPIPEDTTIMNFQHLLEKHKLAPAILAVINGYLQEKGLSLRQGTIVDATIIHAPSSTKNEEGKRDPERSNIRSDEQAPVWLCESALSWADEKHCSTDHAVCSVEPLDGSKTADGYGRVTRVTRGAGLKSPTKQCRRAFLR